MKILYLVVFVCCFALVFGLAACECDPGKDGEAWDHYGDDDDDHGGSDDDDDNEKSPIDLVSAAVDEIVEGLLARTPEALEEKVFPYVAEDFNSAGLDSEGFKNYLLADLRRVPNLVYAEYTVSKTILEEQNSIGAEVTIDYNAVQLAGNNKEIPWGLRGNVVLSMDFYSSRKDEDAYKMKSFQMSDGFAEISGGMGMDVVYGSDFIIDTQDVWQNETITVKGTIRLPQLAEGERLEASFGLNWGDWRGNPQVWQYPEAVVFAQDWTELQGQFVLMDLMLPDDGLPENTGIPYKLPLGVTTVEYRMLFRRIAADGRVMGVSGQSMFLPIYGRVNQPYCAQSLTEDADGIWLLRVDDGSVQLLDVREPVHWLYGTTLSSVTGDDGTVGSLDFTGYEIHEEVTLRSSDDDTLVYYRAVRQGDRLVGGTIEDFSSEMKDVTGFVGRKLSNRCVGLSPYDLDGAALLVDFDDRKLVCLAQRNGEEVFINCGAEHFAGRMTRNVLLARSTTDNTLLLLAFADNLYAEALLVDSPAGEPRQGAVFVQ
ncbi:MAG TPA: hypothetical protein PKW95_12700 [bacterium]|nr:hypothetical protein [bacterium]